MKKLLLLFLLLITSNLIFSQDCGEAFFDDTPIGTVSFFFRTPTLLTGNDEVSTLYYQYKYEIISNSDNQVVKTGYFDPEDYYFFQFSRYNYPLITFNSDCEYDGSHGLSFRMAITKLHIYDPTPSNNFFFPHPYSYDHQIIDSELCTISNNGFLGNLSQCGNDDGGGDGGNEDPNLTWGNIVVTVAGTSYNVNNGQTPILKKDNWADFNITINNNDDGNAGNFDCLLLVSASPDAYPIPNSSPVYNFQTASFNSISANSSGSTTISNFIGEFIGGLDLVNNQTYYMYLDIDYNNTINESNENDNITVFPFKYNDGSTGRVAYLNLGYGLIEVPLGNNIIINNKLQLRRTNLKIYSLSTGATLPLINQSVQNGQTINVSSLPGGTYVVHINDSYVKKFKKFGIIGPMK